MLRQKRGAAVITLFSMAELVMLGIAILCFLLIGAKLAETSYEKNFIARDMALLINTIYASPGDVEYIYDLSALKSDLNKFDFEIKNGYVTVYDSGFKKPQNYRFAGKEDYEITEFRAEAPKAVKFVKKGSQISMEALY